MRGTTFRTRAPQKARSANTTTSTTLRGAANIARVLPESTRGVLPFSMQRGPFQNNGATPWYCNLPLGADGQVMKMALDSGSNFIWVTSTLCGPTGCVHYGGDQFDPDSSASFEWLSTTPKSVDFGPWGSMMVESGRDLVWLPNGMPQSTAFYLSSAYDGSQFAELDWDGGLGFPAGSAWTDPNVSFFLADLMNSGQIDPCMPFVQFTFDASRKSGTTLIGGLDPSQWVENEWLWLPFTPYTAVQGVEYIWSTTLASLLVGDTPIASNVTFSLDSGSSQFKGDPDLMNQILGLVTATPTLDVTLRTGFDENGQQGTLLVPPSLYRVEIEAGQGAGTTVPQFAPLPGVPELVLVGSVLMDSLSTVLDYSVSLTHDGFSLAPRGMYIFNKPGGPKVIRASGRGAPNKLGRRPFTRR